MSEFTPPWRLRQNFADRLSLMYREEVPAYGTLVDLVEKNYVHPRVAQAASPSPEEIKMRLRGIQTK